MTISTYIREKVLEPRLREKQVVVLYDDAGRYHDLAKSAASDKIRVIDASDSVVEAREAAMEAVTALGTQPEKASSVLVYVPGSPPTDDEARTSDFFSALAAAGDFFPNGDGDSYLNLCLSAKPDFGTRIRELFAGGEPSFEAVDAIGDGGGRFPRLKTELGCESNAEILATFMAPREEQEPPLKRTGSCRREALDFLRQVIGFQPKEATASWSLIRSELWRFVLFSEFVFDLPVELPDSLSTVARAPGEVVDLINRVCESLRDGARTRPIYLEESERIAAELGLEEEMVEVRDLGVRDTFSFEERSFLAGYIDALRAGDHARAEAIASARKHSVWVQESDRQLLWTLAERALELRRGLADFDRELSEVKPETSELIAFYTGRGYRLDQRHRYFEETLAEIDEDSEDIDRLVEECRLGYRQAVDRLQRLFMAAVRKSGWPVNGVPAAGSLFDSRVRPLLAEKDAKVAVLWVDALRYELAVALNESLADQQKTDLATVCGALPSITPVGMAALLPNAAGLPQKMKDGKLTPHLGERPVASAQDRVAVLAGEFGDRFIDVPLDELVKKGGAKAFRDKVAHKALMLVRYHRIDLDGEKHAPDLFDTLKRHTDNLLKAVRRLGDLGYRDIFLFTDHGFLVFAERDHGNKATKPDGNWLLEKDRVLVGSATENPETVRFAAADLGVAGEAEHLVFPKTLATFVEGVLYYHGGLSIQECVLPALHVRSRKSDELGRPTWDLQLGYRGKTTGVATTRRPMIEVAAFSDHIFKQDIVFKLVALDGTGEIVGTAASGENTDKNTGYVTVQTGQTAKIPLRLADDFNGTLEVRAQDPDTGKFLGNAVKLETRILE